MSNENNTDNASRKPVNAETKPTPINLSVMKQTSPKNIQTTSVDEVNENPATELFALSVNPGVGILSTGS